jgi:hypothetical protein
MEGTLGYNRLNRNMLQHGLLTLKIEFENYWKWKIAIFTKLILFDFDDIPTEGRPSYKLSNSEDIITLLVPEIYHS